MATTMSESETIKSQEKIQKIGSQFQARSIANPKLQPD